MIDIHFVKVDLTKNMNKIKYMKKKLLTKQEIIEVLDSLETKYPDAKCELDYDSVYHLLLAVVLSAQTTDVSVNLASPALFTKYKTPQDLAEADVSEVEEMIRKIGLYKSKARNIVALSKMLVESYEGEVPGDFAELIKLPGVGRKTANVMMAEAFGEQRIAVDTHVFRLANKIGLCDEKDADKTEAALMKRIPQDRWTRAHHLLIFHGRRCCEARKPRCEECPISHLCISYNK